MRISVIVPVLNEETGIDASLQALEALRGDKEILVVDGGSIDQTVKLASQHNVNVIHASRGRGQQQRAGAQQASGDVFWFLHADTLPPANALEDIAAAVENGASAGNFALRFAGNSRAAHQLTFIYPLLRILRLCYGDSGIFVSKEIYKRVGGFRDLPLFEDLDLLRRLRGAGRFVHLRCALITSSRRFENRNFTLVWIRWIGLQLLYWCGVSPHRLARWYVR